MKKSIRFMAINNVGSKWQIAQEPQGYIYDINRGREFLINRKEILPGSDRYSYEKICLICPSQKVREVRWNGDEIENSFGQIRVHKGLYAPLNDFRIYEAVLEFNLDKKKLKEMKSNILRRANKKMRTLEEVAIRNEEYKSDINGFEMYERDNKYGKEINERFLHFILCKKHADQKTVVLRKIKKTLFKEVPFLEAQKPYRWFTYKDIEELRKTGMKEYYDRDISIGNFLKRHFSESESVARNIRSLPLLELAKGQKSN